MRDAAVVVDFDQSQRLVILTQLGRSWTAHRLDSALGVNAHDEQDMRIQKLLQFGRVARFYRLLERCSRRGIERGAQNL